MLKDDVDLCTKTLIFNTARNLRCDYVTQHCQDKCDFTNYFSLYFCTFDQNWVLITMVCLSALFLQIRMLEYTSGGFISEAIGKVAGYLKLTEAMAGATLLAFSNGATDVITALVAGSRDDGDDLAVGALFGASTFAITIILACVIWARPGNLIQDLKRGNLVRDITTYLISVTVFIILGFYKSNYGIIGTILILIYIVYVFVVWLEERKKTTTIGTDKKNRDSLKPADNLKSLLTGPSDYDDNGSSNNNLNSGLDSQETPGTLNTMNLNDIDDESKNNTGKVIDRFSVYPFVGAGNDLKTPLVGNQEEAKESNKRQNDDDETRSKNTSVISEGKILARDFIKVKGKRNSKKVIYKVKRRVVEKWADMSIGWKIVYVIESPIKLAVYLFNIYF